MKAPIAKMEKYTPTLSIIIPTLNCRDVLNKCLRTIYSQDYPRERIEILIADGNSTDGTRELVAEISMADPRVELLDNSRLKTGEAGKAIGAAHAKNEILAFIDSDNILPGTDWFSRMVEPFGDLSIMAAEPIEYTYRKEDGCITRYCALMGMNDPLCFFIGNYDRYNHITGKWTLMPHKESDAGNYVKAELCKDRLPTIGANGFLIRRNILDGYRIGDYLFDIDILCSIAGTIKIAKVKIGIVHLFAGGILNFMRKQKRRIKDYGYYKKIGLRKYEWGRIGSLGIIKFVIYTILVLPILFQALRGYIRKKDTAWCFHIPACLVTLFIYAFLSIQNLFVLSPLKREAWRLGEWRAL